MKEIEGLKIIQALAQHHPETLKTLKLHEVCLVLIEKVSYTLSSLYICFSKGGRSTQIFYLSKSS